MISSTLNYELLISNFECEALVGAIIAILGFAGIGSLLIQIGVVVFVVGLVLWLLDVLS